MIDATELINANWRFAVACGTFDINTMKRQVLCQHEIFEVHVSQTRSNLRHRKAIQDTKL
jgi:hypothetical protein